MRRIINMLRPVVREEVEQEKDRVFMRLEKERTKEQLNRINRRLREIEASIIGRSP